MAMSFNYFLPSVPYFLGLLVAFIICFINFSKNRSAARLCLIGLGLTGTQLLFSLGSFLLVQWWMNSGNNAGNNPQLLGILMMVFQICSSLANGGGLILIVLAVFKGRQHEMEQLDEKVF